MICQATHFKPENSEDWVDVCEVDKGVIYNDSFIELLCGRAPGVIRYKHQEYAFTRHEGETVVFIESNDPELYPVILRDRPKLLKGRQLYKFSKDSRLVGIQQG